MSLTAEDICKGIQARRQIRVLLVDDQAMIAEGIKRMLAAESDIEFFYCQEPAKAIESAIDIDATVILLDLVMPDIDGMTLVRFFRANQSTKDIPVIVMSSKEDPEIKRDAFSHGANDYLVKLPEQIELIARIRAHSKQYNLQIERDAAFYALREVQRQLEVTNAELHRLSATDALTGIPNRRIFDETMHNEWRRAIREKTWLTIVIIDIDHFKLFNDHYGHQAGDDALHQVAQALSTIIRRPGDMLARYGGEEFGVILPNTDQLGTGAISQRFIEAVNNLNIEHKESKTLDKVTISLGAASIMPVQEVKPEDVLKEADKALYRAKENGRNQSVCVLHKV